MKKKENEILRTLKRKIDEIKINPENIIVLKETQDLIIEEIMRLEKIKKNTRKRRKFAIQKQIFNIKNFGDAIAHIYIDTHNLKQLTYNLDNNEVKNSSGDIFQKEGFKYEYDILSEILAQKIPCVLCDITNSIRYGDICILVGPDPQIIECKMGKNKNKRVRRQIENLKNLERFYTEDIKTTNMGLMEVRRFSQNQSDKNYYHIINEMISKAKEKKEVINKIEKGLYYIVLTKKSRKPLKRVIPSEIKSPLVFYLNSYKSNEEWLSYYPYCLSIRDEDELINFINGDLHIIVIVDINKIKGIASSHGMVFQEQMDPNYPFEFYIKDENGEVKSMFRISMHYFNRVGLEFLSLNWLIQSSKEHYESYHIKKT